MPAMPSAGSWPSRPRDWSGAGDAHDVLAGDVLLPDDVHAGDLLAVTGTGAYHHSRARTYGMVGRTPLVAVAGGEARLLVRRETDDDLLAREVGD
jgi:diaminopimelate decarboxylase